MTNENNDQLLNPDQNQPLTIADSQAQILDENGNNISDEDTKKLLKTESQEFVELLVKKSLQKVQDEQLTIDENERRNKSANQLTTESKEFCEMLVKRSLNNVQEKIIIDQCCEQANLMVDTLITKLSQSNIQQNGEEEEEEVVPSGSFENLPIDEPHWLRIKDFSIKMGKQKIEEYIKTWQRNESWLYHISYLCEDEFQYSRRYRYKVQWSIATRRKPIPRATASVYFTIAASTVKPKNNDAPIHSRFVSVPIVCDVLQEKGTSQDVDVKNQHFPCQVYFIFETSKLVHRPGQTTFREKWLKDIVESKIFMMETVTF